MIDISILFSTRDRAGSLRQTLDDLACLDTSGLAHEIIAVDNGSSDETAAVLRAARDKLPLVPLCEPRAGKNRALNLAMSKARGELLLFTDDDITPDRNWLTCMLAASKRWPQEAIFGGRIKVAFPDITPDWIRHLPPRYVNRAYAAYAPAGEEGIVRNSPTGPNFMVRRKCLNGMRYEDRIGPAGSDYAMGSETEFLLRLQDKGSRFVYVPSATVTHRIRPDQVTLSWLLGRAHRAGRGAERLNRGERRKFLGYTWTGAVRTLVAGPVYFCLRPLAEKYQFKVGWQYYLGLGQMFENRKMKRESA